MALEPAPRRLVMNADRLGWVLIGECTSDNGVHVHRNANSMCAPALPYTAACLTVVARPPERRRRSGAFGRRWERPPSPRAWYGRGAECVFTPSAPALQGSLPVQVSLAGRQTPRQSSRPWQTRSPFGRPWRCSGPGRSPARCAGGSWLPQLGRSRYILVRSLAETLAEQSCLLPRSPG